MKLTVEERTIYGKQTKLLRKQGFVPCSIYGKHVETTMHVMVKKNEFIKAYRQVGSSQVIDLVGAASQMVLVHEYQKNPITDEVIHIDFLAVNANEVVTAEVAVTLTGISPFEKEGLGKVELAKDFVRVQALPKDLPHHFELDISVIAGLDDGIFVKDVVVSDKVEILDDPEIILVAAVALREEVEEETVVEPLEEETTEEKAE